MKINNEMKVGREICITYYTYFVPTSHHLPTINQTISISLLHMKLILLWTLIIL